MSHYQSQTGYGEKGRLPSLEPRSRVLVQGSCHRIKYTCPDRTGRKVNPKLVFYALIKKTSYTRRMQYYLH